jgi:hypothetical protein
MTYHENRQDRHERYGHGDGFVSAVAFGGFLIIIGLIFALNASLWGSVLDFFRDINSRSVPFSGYSNVVLPAPSHPADHLMMYGALLQFDVAFGVLQLIILAIRLRVGSRTRRVAETLGHAVFWLGAAGAVYVFLLNGTLEGWFEYWAALLIIMGISFIVRAIVHFSRRSV